MQSYGVCCYTSQETDDEFLENALQYSRLEGSPSRASGAGQIIRYEEAMNNDDKMLRGESAQGWPPQAPTHPPSLTDRPWWTTGGQPTTTTSWQQWPTTPSPPKTTTSWQSWLPTTTRRPVTRPPVTSWLPQTTARGNEKKICYTSPVIDISIVD